MTKMNRVEKAQINAEHGKILQRNPIVVSWRKADLVVQRHSSGLEEALKKIKLFASKKA